MDAAHALNAAIDYIEFHLNEPIDFKTLARITGYSTYEFQRLFSAVSTLSLAEYIRRRRLSCAALDIQNDAVTLTQTAQKYGYGSQEAFTRAFQRQHGVSPMAARQDGSLLDIQPRLIFQIKVYGVEGSFPVRFERRGPFRFVGRRYRVSNYDTYFDTVSSFWPAFPSHERAELISLCNLPPLGLGGASTNYTEEGYDYYIAAATTKEVPPGYDALEVPAGRWAVFAGQGPAREIQPFLRNKLFSEWLPGSGFEQAFPIDFEWYSPDNPTSPFYRMEVWVPIQPFGTAGEGVIG